MQAVVPGKAAAVRQFISPFHGNISSAVPAQPVLFCLQRIITISYDRLSGAADFREVCSRRAMLTAPRIIRSSSRNASMSGACRIE